MLRIRTRQPVGGMPPRRRSFPSLLRRTRSEKRDIYREAADTIRAGRPAVALAWIGENLKPEAARMLETCLSTYGPNEALRWISYWEGKKEPIGKPARVPAAGASLH